MVSNSRSTTPFTARQLPIMRNRLFILIGFLVILTGIRLFLAGTIDLSPEESYYSLWSQHPDLWYYGQGPGVALAILAGTSLLDSIAMTPDGLCLFFWAAALYTCWLAIERDGNFSIFWPLTGILIGLGFICNYWNA